jgi:hypothetical protein
MVAKPPPIHANRGHSGRAGASIPADPRPRAVDERDGSGACLRSHGGHYSAFLDSGYSSSQADTRIMCYPATKGLFLEIPSPRGGDEFSCLSAGQGEREDAAD